MSFILADTGIVATHHASRATHPSGHNGIVKGTEGATIDATLHVANVFMGETGDQPVYRFGDIDLATLGEGVNTQAYDLLGNL